MSEHVCMCGIVEFAAACMGWPVRDLVLFLEGCR